MPLKIDYPGLVQAMSHYDPLRENLYYLDTQTGQILLVGDYIEEEARLFDEPDQIDEPAIRLAWYLLWQDGEIGEELPEAEEAAMDERVEAYLDRFEPVPAVESYESYQDMVDFAETVTDPHLRDLLDLALSGKGAFRRFKEALLAYPAERERWFAFEEQRLRQRVDDWLRALGVLPEDATAVETIGPAAEEPARPAEEPEAAEPAAGTRPSLLLNFSHPLTEKHRSKIEGITGQTLDRVIDIPVQIDPQLPLIPQVKTLAEQAGLSASDWQRLPLLINPPALNYIAVTLLAELHGRCGYFPACLRLRPVSGSVPIRYEIAEIINLQVVRDKARLHRHDEA